MSSESDTTPSSSSHASPTETFIQKLKNDTLYQKVLELLYWRDKVDSALVFLILNIFYYLITYGEYTVLTLFTYVLLLFHATVIVVVSLSYFWDHCNHQELKNPLTTRIDRKKIQISKKHLDHHVDLFVDFVNFALDRFTYIFFVENLLDSLKYAVYIYLLSWLGELLSGIMLIFLVTLFAFLWPRVYEEKNKEIERFHNLMHNRIEPHLTFVQHKIDDFKKHFKTE